MDALTLVSGHLRLFPGPAIIALSVMSAALISRHEGRLSEERGMQH